MKSDTETRPVAGAPADAAETRPTPGGKVAVRAEPEAEAKATAKVFLTTRSSAAFGGRGRFVTPTADELAAAPDGLLVEPTPEQLAQRG